MQTKPWNNHYNRDRSLLTYPDENLVRMVARVVKNQNAQTMRAIDIGSGSGRHIALLKNFLFGKIYATDITHNATKICAHYGIPSIECATEKLPFKSRLFDVAVCWGSLHYDTFSGSQKQIAEVHRTLKAGGILFGTFRSKRDRLFTRKRKLNKHSWRVTTDDLTESTVTMVNKRELKKLLSQFESVEIGLMERTLPNSKKRVSHFYFQAKKGV